MLSWSLQKRLLSTYYVPGPVFGALLFWFMLTITSGDRSNYHAHITYKERSSEAKQFAPDPS